MGKVEDIRTSPGGSREPEPPSPGRTECLPSPGTFDVDGNRIRFLRDGRQVYPAMLEAIARAKREILLEMYWFQGDKAGMLFRDALAAKAREGVDVKVSFDAIGSMGAPWSMWEPLLAAGGQVVEFAPISPLRRRFRVRALNHRDHRKILVVDDRIGFTGGMNIGDPWLPAEEGGQDWRDDALEVEGPVASDMRALFFETWRREGRSAPADARRLSRKVPPSSKVVLLAGGHGPKRGIRHTYLKAIRNARRQIEITNPYFLPGPILLAAILGARRRGVEVRILVPGISDVWVVSMAMSSIIGRLLENDVRVFAYQGRVLHAKTGVFDESSTTVGTYNLDPRSRRYNRECNIVVHDAALARAVRASFEADLLHATELSLASWKEQPLLHRFLAWLAYPARQFL
jgi:cardiolipin synthase